MNLLSAIWFLNRTFLAANKAKQAPHPKRNGRGSSGGTKQFPMKCWSKGHFVHSNRGPMGAVKPTQRRVKQVSSSSCGSCLHHPKFTASGTRECQRNCPTRRIFETGLWVFVHAAAMVRVYTKRGVETNCFHTFVPREGNKLYGSMILVSQYLVF